MATTHPPLAWPAPNPPPLPPLERRERKNVNLPGVVVDLPTLTSKDIDDIVNWCIPNDIDFIAASFVRKGSDIDNVRQVRRAGVQGVGGQGWGASGRAAAGAAVGGAAVLPALLLLARSLCSCTSSSLQSRGHACSRALTSRGHACSCALTHQPTHTH